MSFRDKFPVAAALLGMSTAIAAVPAPAEATTQTGPAPAATTPTPNTAALESAIAADTAAQVTAAVDAERTRWQAVLSDDAGKANVQGAVELLGKTPMAATDVLATLKDMGVPAQSAPNARVTDRLANLDKGAAAPKTGTAGNPAAGDDGTGEDAPDPTAAVKAQRAARADKAKASAESKGLKLANA